MASCITPSALAGSTWLTMLAICAFLSLTIAASDWASWPCGDERDSERLPPNANCWSDCTPVRIAESVGNTTPFGVNWMAGTAVPVMSETRDDGGIGVGADHDHGAGELPGCVQAEAHHGHGHDARDGHGGLLQEIRDVGLRRQLAEDVLEVRQPQRHVIPAFADEGTNGRGHVLRDAVVRVGKGQVAVAVQHQIPCGRVKW